MPTNNLVEARPRTTFLGGSDAAGVLGLSRWDTPLSVWAEKTGQFVRPDLDSEAAELGRELEDYVAKRFCRKTGKSVVRAEGTVFHPDFGFLGANVDRLLEGEEAGLECKTCSPWKSKEWEGEDIPQEYIAQCYHYMMVTGLRKWYIAVLIGNQEFKWKEIAWDPKIGAQMLQRETTFWTEFVIPKVMPSQITRFDADTLQGLFPVAEEGKVLQLGDDASKLCENLEALKADAKSLEQQIDLTENQLKALLGAAEGADTPLYKIRWSNLITKRFDTKAFEAQHPELCAKFRKPTASRRFSYKPLKKETL